MNPTDALAVQVRKFLDSLPEWVVIGIGLLLLANAVLWFFLPFIVLSANSYLKQIARNMEWLRRDVESRGRKPPQ